MKDRLKKLREMLGISQEVFGERLKIKRSHVSSLENGTRNITDRIIADICREFTVNENWLRYGDGAIFTAIPTEELDKLAERYKLSNMAKHFVKTFVELEENEMNAVLNFIINAVTPTDEIAATKEKDLTQKDVSHVRSILKDENISTK